jgi:hypothetical protein
VFLTLSASVSTWETYPVLLNQVRDTIEIEFDIVPGREGNNLFWIKRRLPTAQFREVTLKPGRRDDLQDARWLVASIPEGMPLIAWLEDQVASIAENNLSTQINANPPFNYKTVFIFIPMPMQRRRERPRFHRMFHERKAAARVIPIDHKSDPSGTKLAGFTILRSQNSRSVAFFFHGPTR